MGFRPKNALNNLFYRTQWLNIDRYGRSGCSPVAGLGQLPLSQWFHISAMSHYIFAFAGAPVMLGGTLAWALLHLAWMSAADLLWVLAVTVTLLLSTTAYAMAFVRQNYNILGWLWLPLALCGVASGQWIIAALAFLAASMASITVIIVAVPLMLTQALITMDEMPLVVLAPGLAKVMSHGLLVLRSGSAQSSLLNLGKHVGLVPSQERYKRRSRRFGPFNLYMSTLYVACCALSWLLNDAVPWLLVCAALIFVVNQRFFRFADDQSVIIMFVSVFTAYTIAMPPSIFAFLLLLLVVNPPPYLLGVLEMDPDSGSRRVAIFEPFDHTRIEQDCESLIESVAANSRILFAFDDPSGAYENLFDGYRNGIEPFFYVATRRNIHLFPDWHAVTATNTEGDFHVWGRSLNEVRANRERWQADFVLYYLASDDELPDEWLNEYRIIGSFDYANHLEDLRQAVPWSGGLACPKFLLLKPLS